MSSQNQEIWKQIEDYPGYEVSNFGFVRNIKTQKNLKMVNGQTNGGYFVFNLRKDGKSKTFLLHRILAQHFIANPDNYQCVDHINFDKHDNTLQNLRWCDFSKNSYNKPKNKSQNRQKTSSQYKGVYWYESKQKWQAYINYEKKRIHLGYFQTEQEAAQKYNEYAIQFHDQFAFLNQIN